MGVGFQRCGTTRWWRLLTDHPGVHRPEQKELHFFDRLRDSEPSAEIGEAYRSEFRRPEGLLCGEWTPRYALDHWTPPLLCAAAPDALLLVALRDPVERFVSGLALSEHRRLTSQASPAAVGENTPAALLRSMYLPQLRHLLRFADRERLFVLQFEKTLTDPAVELRRTYAALGLDPSFEPTALAEPVNAREAPGRLEAAERRSLVHWLEDEVAQLAAEFPEIELGLWPNFAHIAG